MATASAVVDIFVRCEVAPPEPSTARVAVQVLQAPPTSSTARVTVGVSEPPPQPSTARVTVQVTAPHVPVFDARNDTTVTTPNTPVVIHVLGNDRVDGQQATPANARPFITRPPTIGTATVNPNGTITYTPPADACGVIDFEYDITWP